LQTLILRSKQNRERNRMLKLTLEKPCLYVLLQIDIVELKQTEDKPLEILTLGAHPESLKLLKQMLRWNPTERISVEQALHDPYVTDYHDPLDEPVCTRRLDFKFDEDKVHIGQFVTLEIITSQCQFLQPC